MISRRQLITYGSTGVAISFISACSGDNAESPEGAAKLIAKSIEKGDPSQGPFRGEALKESFEQITSKVGVSPNVSVTAVNPSSQENSRTARLLYTWPLGDEDVWSYNVEVPLTKLGKTWSARWSPGLVHPDLGEGDVLRVNRVAGDRGQILDRNETPIVKRRPVVIVGIDKPSAKPDEWDASARQLAKLVDIDAQQFSKTVASSGKKAFVEAITLRAESLSSDKRSALSKIKGSLIVESERDLAPSKTFARPVLGVVAPATAEQIKSSNGKVTIGDFVGSGGLQQQFDSSLRGRRVIEIYAVSTSGGPSGQDRLLHRTKNADGTPLRTTLDQTLQQKAEELLASHKDKPTALVAIKPSTGELLAVASGPGGEGFDTARQGRYAPGSTFKVVSALALIRAGQQVDGKVECTPTIQANGRLYRNFPEYPKDKLGTVTFKTAIANSCNTVMVRGAGKTPASEIAAAASSLGLTQSLGNVGFSGSVPDSDIGAEHDSSMIGQGRLLASPLGMATVIASVSAGKRVTPYLVGGHKPNPSAPDKELSPEEARNLRALTRAVVEEGGGVSLKGIPGGPVIAKTGTAEFGKEDPPRVNSWMIAAQGDIAVAVFVSEGGYGAVACSPIVRQFLESAT